MTLFVKFNRIILGINKNRKNNMFNNKLITKTLAFISGFPLLIACQEGQPWPDPATAKVTAAISQTIGGSISTADSLIKLNIPPNSMGSDAKISLEYTNTTIAPPESGLRIVGKPFDFGPEGTGFDMKNPP